MRRFGTVYTVNSAEEMVANLMWQGGINEAGYDVQQANQTASNSLVVLVIGGIVSVGVLWWASK